MSLSRRTLLAGTAVAVCLPFAAKSIEIQGALPWKPNAGDPPPQAVAGPWVFFTPEEGAAVEALVDRLIPPDPQTPGGKDCGCAVFIDRQLAGPYGVSEWLYMRPPFAEGAPTQGPQSPLTPQMRYRQGLAALATFSRHAYAGKQVHELSDSALDELLTGLEKGQLQLEGASGKGFFEQLVKDTRQGFFADPVYGGNRDMAAWKMIGFPGARYNYLDWVQKHNEKYPRPPVGIQGRPEWAEAGKS